MTVELFEGDNRLTLRRLIDEGVRVHSVVTDPPYGLTSVTKRFGKDGSAPARTEGTDGSFSRLSRGFMNKTWDGTGIERDPEFWRLIYDILLPGGYCVAFSGARTGHWQAVAMEQAGFIMHPMIGWCFASGFPKAHNAAGAIDRHLGHGNRGSQIAAASSVHPTTGEKLRPGDNLPPYQPRSPEAVVWEGWAYGAQALKPALEPIYVAQKPFDQKNGALNILTHGAGAINIDGCRVPSTGEVTGWGGGGMSGATFNSVTSGLGKSGEPRPVLGRHPANLIHDGSAEVTALFPDSKGQQGDVRGTEPSHTGDENTHCYGEYGRVASPKRGDTDGSAARFFNSFPPILYNKKADKTDRAGSKHPTVKPIALMQHLVRLVTPPGGTVLDPFAGSGTTGEAAQREGANCILMEAEASYATDIRARLGLTPPCNLDALLGSSPTKLADLLA